MSDASSRRVLCVSPRYAPSFGTFEYAYELMPGVAAFMPPQGLLVVAASLPASWPVQFVDENIRPATPEAFQWADVVFVSGMHVQRRAIQDIARRAHAAGRPCVLGGPSVSASPELYPDCDFLHIGELGDATEALIARLEHDVARPERQEVFETRERRPLDRFPTPAYALAEIRRYFIGSVQFSSGCPYRCEFCDIPSLYGRVPRLKTVDQVLQELDQLLARGVRAVYFVDDNFIAHRPAAKALLSALIGWQKSRGYALSFACEATLNMARSPEILAMMREAGFETVFCGIETPDPKALAAMSKGHNMMVPILEAVRTLNAHGLEVVSGIILGLDEDDALTGERILEFVNASMIPMLTINLLQALPRTPLYERLTQEGRLVEDEDRETNVAFRMPYEEVLAMWRTTMARAFAPEAVFERYEHQARHTYPNRLPRPASPERASLRNVALGISLLSRILWTLGVRSDYRAVFWRFTWPKLRRGEIETVIQAGLVSRHLIAFAREAASGRAAASHYASKLKEPAALAAE